MKSFNWDEFRSKKIAVRCDTAEKANDFLKQAYEHDFVWEYGAPLSDCNFYGIHLKQTCYRGYDGLGYGNLSYYKSEGYKIVEWEIDNMKEFTKEDLEVGMLVETKCGERAILMPHKKNGCLALAYKNGGVDWVTFNRDFSFSIVKVWSPLCCLDFSACNRITLWEYKEAEEMTLEAVCEELGRNIKIIK